MSTIRTSKGKVEVGKAFSDFCAHVRGPTFDYAYLKGILNKLPDNFAKTASELVIWDALNNPSKYSERPCRRLLGQAYYIASRFKPKFAFPGRGRTSLVSQWPHVGRVYGREV